MAAALGHELLPLAKTGAAQWRIASAPQGEAKGPNRSDNGYISPTLAKRPGH